MLVTRADDDLAFVHATMGSNLDTMLVFNILRTHSYLAPFVDADLRRQQLTAAQLNALLVLRKAADAGLLMSDIGQKLVVTKSNVTGLVDRLEAQGLVLRLEHPDRRATLIRITPAGRQLVDQAAPHHARLLAELASCLTAPEKKTLVALLTKLRAELRRRREEL